MPELISRKSYNAWQAEGGLTLRQRARAKLLEIMDLSHIYKIIGHFMFQKL